MAERVPPLEASIHIDAPPARVWQIVADQRRMKEFSPEVYGQKFFGDEIGRGTISINLNQRKGFFWPSASRITEFVPEKRLAFYVYGPADTWSYDLAPDGNGTLLTERRELKNGNGTLLTERRELKNGKRSFLSRVTAAAALGGIDSHDVELKAGMETTLARIKAEAERTP